LRFSAIQRVLLFAADDIMGGASSLARRESHGDILQWAVNAKRELQTEQHGADRRVPRILEHLDALIATIM
jgi:hypothetical protein